jgi:hypothetical protein
MTAHRSRHKSWISSDACWRKCRNSGGRQSSSSNSDANWLLHCGRSIPRMVDLIANVSIACTNNSHKAAPGGAGTPAEGLIPQPSLERCRTMAKGATRRLVNHEHPSWCSKTYGEPNDARHDPHVSAPERVDAHHPSEMAITAYLALYKRPITRDPVRRSRCWSSTTPPPARNRSLSCSPATSCAACRRRCTGWS